MNKQFAQFMVESNTVTKLFQRLTDVGNEAVDLLGLLLPLPEFPDEAIKLTHPYHFAETVSVKTIWRSENGDILFHWWGEENGIGKLERYNPEDRVWLLRSIVNYLAKQ